MINPTTLFLSHISLVRVIVASEMNMNHEREAKYFVDEIYIS